ncbi:MAG: phage tail sheath subtilisin-like domain-containing protein [Proteobacteria bacterium]|nr:phage tail sheath subtilisin-like domain-containing protein [Cystobacterineae bacterium]MCL2258627.1 phage tail sheath subtilisin-like domain-containing protein [Cystobacterineae bacterium]MCL2315012.1 phage tail sheath subtilisin-like domain-containing protein [Pseudomonadota bacterium]
MATYPGVYIEEINSGVRPIESASTSTALFIGKTIKGKLNEPKLIFRWVDYVEAFGFQREEVEEGEEEEGGEEEEEGEEEAEGGGAAQLAAGEIDAMGFAVYNFFLNGGGGAYIVNVGEGAIAKNYEDVFGALEKIRDISIICLPGKVLSPGISNAVDKSIIAAAISHAEDMKNRMVIVDLAQEERLVDAASVGALGLPSSKFSVAYYPWIEVANPSYKPAEEGEEPSLEPPTLMVAPSGFVAGMWAKIDERRGVWKAPAGVETALLGVAGLADNVDDKLQGHLNPLGINCIRKIPGAGPVIWGSRTLATKALPEWRYLPVRRTASMIEESIYTNIQWAVFEPNDHRLWSSLRVNIDAFMNGLWRAGAFQGEKASDAYFVRCNLDDTMMQADVDLGKVIVEVGFAPLKPAEFVIVRIQQKVAQQ